MKRIAMGDFAKRQTMESEYSHFAGTWEELESLVEANFDNQTPGYRDGVVLISVPSDLFFSSLVDLKKADKKFLSLSTQFASRREGEEPYLKVFVNGSHEMLKKLGRRTDIVLYRHDVLAENDEQSTDAEWEIVSINVSPTKKEVPMPPMTRARNILEMEGGTSTKLEEKDKEELIQLIKNMAEATVFWSQHALILY